MTEAIFGLVGVLIGGLITAGTEWANRRAATRRAQQLAARVLFDELANVLASARHSISVQRPELSFPSKLELPDMWREYRQDLGEVDWHIWIAIDHAVASLETTTSSTAWNQGREEWLTTVAEDAELAIGAIEPFVQRTRWPWTPWRR